MPAQARSADRRRRPGGPRRLPADHPRVGDAHRDRRSRRARRICPRICAFWNEVSATADTCLGTECPRYDDCFVTRMRQRAAASDVVIVNHHLLCADAAVRQNAFGEVIPACTRAILDEAHQLEDVATQYFGFSVSNYRVEELARDVERLVATGGVERPRARRTRSRRRSSGCATTRGRSSPSSRSRTAATGARRARSACAPRAESLGQTHDARRATSPARSTSSRRRSRCCGRSGRAGRRDATRDERSDDEAVGEDARDARRGAPASCATTCASCCAAATTTYVYFVEFRGRGIFLRASPIDVSTIVRELLLDRMRTTVLTSATLTVDGRSTTSATRLGIGRRRRDPPAVGVRLPAAGDPLPAAADARSALGRTSPSPPAAR